MSGPADVAKYLMEHHGHSTGEAIEDLLSENAALRAELARLEARLENTQPYIRRAQEFEAQVVQLREALIDRRSGRPQCRCCSGYLDVPHDDHLKGCWAASALSSTPADTLERYRAMDALCEAVFTYPPNELPQRILDAAHALAAVNSKERAALERGEGEGR